MDEKCGMTKKISIMDENPFTWMKKEEKT